MATTNIQREDNLKKRFLQLANLKLGFYFCQRSKIKIIN